MTSMILMKYLLKSNFICYVFTDISNAMIFHDREVASNGFYLKLK